MKRNRRIRVENKKNSDKRRKTKTISIFYNSAIPLQTSMPESKKVDLFFLFYICIIQLIV